MKSNYKRLGDYIQLVDVRNQDNAIGSDRLLGINIDKRFMPSVANVSGTDLTRYKVIRKDLFACNVMHVGRDERIPISFYTDYDPAIISPAYLMFEIQNGDLLPEFLMINFLRPEFDRYAGYICDSSIRGGLEWERFCDIEIPLPDIEEQRKYVALYNALQKNQQAYEKTLDDLQLVCDAFMEKLKDSGPHRQLGEYVQLIDKRNVEGRIKTLLGVNINKEYMNSKANVSDSSLKRYKIIHKGLFACNMMHVGRDVKLPVALYNCNTPAIVSPAYHVFKPLKTDKLLPEFMMIWFRRAEFDRYTGFISDSSVRGGLEWERFCDIKIPIPSVEVQESIVAIHHTLETRKRLNNKLKKQTENICPILIRGVVEEIEGSA